MAANTVTKLPDILEQQFENMEVLVLGREPR